MKSFFIKYDLSPILLMSAVLLMLTFLFLFIFFFVFKILYFKKSSENIKNNNRKSLKLFGSFKFLPYYQILFVGVFLSALLLFWNTVDAPQNFFKRLVQSAIDSLRLFTLELRLNELEDKFFSSNATVSALRNYYISFLSVFAPFCTVVAAVSLFFNDLFVQIKYLIPFRKVFVLSELNENSFSLAKDIRKNHSFSLIIFTGVSKNDSENDSDDLLGKVKEINAKTTKKSVTDFNFFRLKKTHVYLINTEEKNNVTNGKKLFEKNRKSNIAIYVFSALKSTETFMKNILEKRSGTKANIYHINIAKMIAYRILLEHPLYDTAERTKDKKISVLVVGSGAISNECAKTAVWCGATDDSNFKIRIINNKKEDPGFKELRENSQSVGMDIDYKFLNVDVENDDFSGISSEIDNTNYIIVETENDELTVNTALKLRRYFIRNAIKKAKYDSEKIPTVIPIIKNSDYIELLGDSKENKYLYPFEYNSNVYNESSLNNYNVKNPDIVIHSIYKLKDIGLHITLSEFKNEHKITFIELSRFLKCRFVKQRKKKLPEIEHKRWTVMRLLEGWITSDTSQLKKNNINEHKMPEAMINAALVKYSKLKDIGKQMYNDENWLIEYNEKVAASVEANAIEAIIKNIEEYNIYISEEDYGKLQTESR